jgi:hypothetical protein
MPEQQAPAVPRTSFGDAVTLWFMRLAASGWVPARWFLRHLPDESARAARSGRLSLEIVSHCWGYAHLQAYQLSSLLLHPPKQLDVTMTVYFSPEDTDTVALLDHFGAMDVPGVQWNWQPLDKYSLFRRAIGRNQAAHATPADWIWFTDCDVVFHSGCLDGLAAALQGRREALVFPRTEYCSALLEPGDPMLEAGKGTPRILDIDPAHFVPQQRDRATGPLQIAHGDVARACGYCEQLAVYQKPVPRWAKAHEDRAFRWLLRTRGIPVDAPGVYRIRHVSKGRYQGSRWSNRLRTRVRAMQARFREPEGPAR